MSAPAHVASVTGAPRPLLVPSLVLAGWASALFLVAGLAGRALGAWVPDVGVLLIVATTARAYGNAPFACALAVSAGRVAVGVDPPIAVVAAYLAVAGAHAGVGAIVDADRLVVRLTACALSAAWVVGWLCVVHELRSEVPLELAGRAPGLALRTALATALVAPLAIPFLRRLPGTGRFGGTE